MIQISYIPITGVSIPFQSMSSLLFQKKISGTDYYIVKDPLYLNLLIHLLLAEVSLQQDGQKGQ